MAKLLPRDRWPIKAVRPLPPARQPATRTPLVNRSEFDIVATYGAEYRGQVQYYLLAGDVHRLNRLHGVMRTSMLKTLACKYDSTARKMAAKLKTKIETPHDTVLARSARESRTSANRAEGPRHQHQHLVVGRLGVNGDG